MENIGKRIKQLRENKGLTLNGLAYRSGISQSYLREIESGRYTNPGVDILSEICWALGVSLSEFFEGFENDTRVQNDEFTKVIDRLRSDQKKALTEFLTTMIDWGLE